MSGQALAEALKEEGIFARAALVIAIIIAALLTWLIVVMAVRRAARRLAAAAETGPPPVRRRQQRAITALWLTANLAKWTIAVACALILLAAVGLGPRLAPLLAGAGILGVALGLGAQTLMRDLLSGLFLLLEGQYAIGDYVKSGDLSGRVTHVGMRVTVLHDDDGQMHHLPNGGMTTVTVRDGPSMPMIVDVTVDPPSAARAASIVGRIADDLSSQYPLWLRIDGPPSVVEGEAYAVVRLPLTGYLGREWLVEEELPARLNPALADADIAQPEDSLPRTYSRPRAPSPNAEVPEP